MSLCVKVFRISSVFTFYVLIRDGDKHEVSKMTDRCMKKGRVYLRNRETFVDDF